MQEALLEVHDLRSGHGGQLAVHGVPLDVRRGEIVALIGPNGAGKSTLLHTIAGLLRPYAGRIVLAGRDITGIKPEHTLASGLAYVPQVGNIFPSLSVLETLEVCYRGKAFANALEEMLAAFPRLRLLLKRNAGLLSGGERQMLAIARALINRPFDLLMADEPSAGLSIDNVRAIFERIEWVRDSGISILLVEQNAARALEIADRAFVMEAGRIVLEDQADALLHSPAVQRHYLGIRQSDEVEVTSTDDAAAARACCAALRDELRQRLPRSETIFFGPAFAESDEPDVARLRVRGAHFFWVAVPVGGASFWDAHVGIVVEPVTLAGTVGIHRSRRCATIARRFADLAPAFESHRLTRHTSEVADEEQWIGQPIDLSSPARIADACRELVILLAVARGGRGN